MIRLIQLLVVLLPVALIAGAIIFIVKLLKGRTANSQSGSAEAETEFSDEEYEQFGQARQEALERILGPMHNMVGHAVIPYYLGGNVHMYYFPNGIPGTGFATMELIQPDGSGPLPGDMGAYELVAFTKLPISAGADADLAISGGAQSEKKPQTPYQKIERRICSIFTSIANYSSQAVLNPGETCEIPSGENQPNICLIFDEYAPDNIPFEIDGERFGLLLCLEIFPEEMNYARENGPDALLEKLKRAGHYPYSDLDRTPVC